LVQKVHRSLRKAFDNASFILDGRPEAGACPERAEGSFILQL